MGMLLPSLIHLIKELLQLLMPKLQNRKLPQQHFVLNPVIELLRSRQNWQSGKQQPVEEMNLEEALDAGLIGTTIKGIAHPDVPSFWPHTETWEEYRERLLASEDEEHH